MRLAHLIRQAWWRVRRPVVVGCLVLAVNARGEVLLVRHSYGSPLWSLPGGGIGRGEAPSDAATRELAEETACMLADPIAVAVIHGGWHGMKSEQHIIAGTTQDTPRPDGREIIAAGWFAPGGLPADSNPRLHWHLAEWLQTYERQRAASE